MNEWILIVIFVVGVYPVLDWLFDFDNVWNKKRVGESK